ncbi:MAG: hypothetical protein ABID61_06505, partial [Candidatus Micrarchaeota archaeon]
GYQKTISVDIRAPETLFTNPMFLTVVFLSLATVAVGIFFARKEATAYQFDIPDFPAIARNKVPLQSDTILGLFNKVNENYHWDFTPLTINELKNGFRTIYYKGRPLTISDFNLEYILNILIRKSMVVESLDYYGLKSWESKTKHSIYYLSLMRRVRDICVNNAVPFTPLGESKICDSEITIVGQLMFLHLYDKKNTVQFMLKKILSTINKGITLVLFQDEDEKAEFEAILNSPTVIPILLKIEGEGRSLLLHTASDFEKMLQEFKSV